MTRLRNCISLGCLLFICFGGVCKDKRMHAVFKIKCSFDVYKPYILAFMCRMLKHFLYFYRESFLGLLKGSMCL